MRRCFTQWELLMPKKAIRAAGYPRVSDPGKKDSATLESQEKAIRKYVTEAGYELDDTLIYSEAHTAYMLPYRDRPQLMKLLEAARRHEFDVLIVTEFSRLSRRQVEQAVIISILEDYGVKVESVTEVFDDSPVGHLMLAINAYVAEVEREKTHWRTNRGRRDRAEVALTGQGEARYGYKYMDSEKYKKAYYVLNEEIIHTDIQGKEWTRPGVINFIVNSLLDGKSLRGIARTLTDLGIPTPMGKLVWSKTTVYYIATDRFYTGAASNFRYIKEGNSYSMKRPEEERIKLPEGIVPVIVSVEKYEAVQQQLELNKQLSVRNNHHPVVGIMRGGFAKCGICGYVLHVRNYNTPNTRGEGNTIRTPDYCCQRREGGEDRTNNHSNTINVRALDEIVWKIATEYIRKPDLVKARIDEVKRENTIETHTDTIKQKLNDANKRAKNIYQLAEFASDEETIASLQRRLAEIEKEKQDLRALLYDAEEQEELQEEVLAEVARFEDWAHQFCAHLDIPDYEPTYEEKQRACAILGINAIIYPPSYEDRVSIEVGPPSILRVISPILPSTKDENCVQQFKKVMPLAAKETKGKASGKKVQELVREMTQ